MPSTVMLTPMLSFLHALFPIPQRCQLKIVLHEKQRGDTADSQRYSSGT